MTETAAASDVKEAPKVMTIEYLHNRYTVTFFKTVQGADVYIGANGKFYACIAGKTWICKPSLNKIEREIINLSKGVGSIKVFFQGNNDKPEIEEIIGVQGTRILFRSGNSCHKHSFSMYRYDEKLYKRCLDYWKRKDESERKFDKEWEKISGDLHHIGGYSIERELTEEAQKAQK